MSDEENQKREHIAHADQSPANEGSATEATTPMLPWATAPTPKTGSAPKTGSVWGPPPDSPPLRIPGADAGDPGGQPSIRPWRPSPAPRPPDETGGAVYVPGAPAPLPSWSSPENLAAPAVAPSSSRWSGLAAGLAIGLVLALVTGTGGYLAGNRVGKHPQPLPSPSPSLHVYESSQAALNRTKLDREFAPLAQPLLPWVGGCTADTDTGGAKLPTDESRHVICRYGGMTVHFSRYRSQDMLDAERTYRQELLASTQELLPGMAQPGRKKGGLSGAPGNYVEYSWKGDDGRAWCGVWWDRDDVPLAGLRLEALCQEGLGGRWEPLRDLWQRYS